MLNMSYRNNSSILTNKPNPYFFFFRISFFALISQYIQNGQDQWVLPSNFNLSKAFDSKYPLTGKFGRKIRVLLFVMFFLIKQSLFNSSTQLFAITL